MLETMRSHFRGLGEKGIVAEYMVARSLVEKDPNYVKRLTPNTAQVVDRNRYQNVRTLEDTRVRLLSGDCDYINASLVCHPIASQKVVETTIVCQAPLEHTSEHFWQLCWEQNVPLIVMLTGLVEPCGGGGFREKCFPYFPQEGGALKFGKYTIRLVSIHCRTDGWTDRELEVEFLQERRRIRHMHCNEWPDFGSLTPHQLGGLKETLSMVRHIRASFVSQPLVVHCSAGIGRSGTFVALETLLGKRECGEELNVVEVVSSLRNQRPGMVQTPEQYQMIYHVILSFGDDEEE